jgi:CubicO group peptidase (beta-lactamase class C family)
MGNIRHGDPTLDEWLKGLGAIPLAYDPGSTFNYGTSFDVLGVLIQRISGKSFGEYLKTAIFDPLGMKDTGFWLPKEKQDRLAAIYGRDPQTGKYVLASRPIPTAPMNFASGAGGLVSTADDYLQFAKVLLNKGRSRDVRLLSHPTIAMMTTNWLTPEQRKAGFVGISDFWASQGFGLGVSITDDVSRLGRNPYTSNGSFGWNGATGVSWRADPEEDMIPIYMVQNAGAVPNAAARGAAPPTPPTIPAANQSRAAMRTPAVVAFFDMAYDAIDA